MDTNKIYEIANKVGQRLTFGSCVHHPALASFFELIELDDLAHQQQQNAIGEFKKKLLVDKLIASELGKMPMYTMLTLPTMTSIIGHTPVEQIKANESEWIKKAFEIMTGYEKQTVELLEQIKQQLHGDTKHTKLIEMLIKETKHELEQIEADKHQLEQLGFDKQKMKGDKKMYPHDEHEHEMRRRHHMEREHLDRQHEHEHEMRRHYRHYGEYPSHGLDHDYGHDARRRRHHAEMPYMPYAPMTPYMNWEHDEEARRRRHYR